MYKFQGFGLQTDPELTVGQQGGAKSESRQSGEDKNAFHVDQDLHV